MAVPRFGTRERQLQTFGIHRCSDPLYAFDGRINIRHNLIVACYDNHLIGPEGHTVNAIPYTIHIDDLALFRDGVGTGKEKVAGHLLDTRRRNLLLCQPFLPMVEKPDIVIPQALEKTQLAGESLSHPHPDACQASRTRIRFGDQRLSRFEGGSLKIVFLECLDGAGHNLIDVPYSDNIHSAPLF